MKSKKQKAENYPKLDKTLALAGLAVIIIGCLANIYSAVVNQRFIHEFIDIGYYYQSIILLGGGFLAGYFLHKKSAKPRRHDRIYLGVLYTLLAIALSSILSVIGFALQNAFGQPPYPWSKVVFMGVPILALGAAAVVAYLAQYKPSYSQPSRFTKIILVLSFIAYELYTLILGTYHVISGVATYEPGASILSVAADYALMPLAIAFVAYLLLRKMKKVFDKLFYAALVGMLYSTFMIGLWHYATNVPHEHMDVVFGAMRVVSLLFVVFLLWRVYLLNKNK